MCPCSIVTLPVPFYYLGALMYSMMVFYYTTTQWLDVGFTYHSKLYIPLRRKKGLPVVDSQARQCVWSDGTVTPVASELQVVASFWGCGLLPLETQNP